MEAGGNEEAANFLTSFARLRTESRAQATNDGGKGYRHRGQY